MYLVLYLNVLCNIDVVKPKLFQVGRALLDMVHSVHILYTRINTAIDV